MSVHPHAKTAIVVYVKLNKNVVTIQLNSTNYYNACTCRHNSFFFFLFDRKIETFFSLFFYFLFFI